MGDQVDGAQRVCFYGEAMLDDPAAFLAGYELGSNATLFSPRVGCGRVPMTWPTIMQLLINKGCLNGKQVLTPTSVDAMLKSVWKLSSSSDNGLSAERPSQAEMLMANDKLRPLRSSHRYACLGF